jgi:hypothetical protein
MRIARSAMLTVPVAEYRNASAVMKSDDASRLMTTYVMPDRTWGGVPPRVIST